MKKALSIGAIGVLVGVATLALPAAGSAAPSVGCTVAAPDTNRLDTTRASDGTPAYTRWLERADVSAANLAVQQAVAAQFDLTGGKEGIATLARRGYVGSTVDHNTQTLVTVVTPERRDQAAALQRRIAGALPAGLAANAVRATVIVGCHSGTRIAAAADLLYARAWHPDAARATFSFSVDASDSRLHVSFDPGSVAAADAARAALGDVAVITVDGASRTGRLDDGEPHYGGAGIRAGSGGISTNTCTSTFAVRRNSDGQRGGLTAGHCFANGQQIYSSTKYWGNAWGERSYPTYDMMGVASSGETYDNQIHVDPCCPSTRNVTSKRNPVVNDSVCLSGMVTRAVCGLVVSDLYASLCDADGCTTGLMQARRASDVTVRGGDSGGPVYLRSGTSNAVALGMIIGSSGGGVNMLGEKLSSIESHLGVSVLTS